MEKTFPTIWFTGLSASGKTTLSTQLYKDLNNIGLDNVVLLDGESIRDEMMNHDFDLKSREEIGILKAKIASDLNNRGKIVLISGIAHKRKWRSDIRQMIDRYYEVYLKCDVDVCAARDYKDQYSKAFAGKYDNFIGVTEQYQESYDADLIIHTGRNKLDKCSSQLLENVMRLLGIK